MAYVQKFTDAPNQTLYAVPSTSTPVTWAAQRVLCTEEYDGKYTVSVDESVATEWWVYIGADVPTDWNDRILEFSVPTATTATTPIIVLPVGFLKNINRNTNNALDLYVGETGTYTTLLTDSKGNPLPLNTGTWEIIVKSPVGSDPSYSFQEDLTVSGDDYATVSFNLGSLCSALRVSHEFSIREQTSHLVKLKGICNVRYAP